MNTIFDLINTYRWIYVIGSCLFFTVTCLFMFRRQRNMYWSWLSSADAGLGTRVQARLGLLGSWGFVAVAVAAWIIFPTIAAADKETLRHWVAMFLAALRQ